MICLDYYEKCYIRCWHTNPTTINPYLILLDYYEKCYTLDDIQRYCILWKSVIAQATIDATSNCKKTESLVEKRKAISWLSDLSQDFVHTCILADCDPVYVKNKIQPILKSLTR